MVLAGFLFSSAVICGALLLPWICRFFYLFWWRPMKLSRLLKKQGISGPPYSLVFGNIMDIIRLDKESQSKPMELSHSLVPRVLPFLHRTLRNHGKFSVIWMGATPRVCLMDPDLIKEVFLDKYGQFKRPKISPVVKVVAPGLVMLEGQKWAKHRRIINPAFHQEKLKSMLSAFLTSCVELISVWNRSFGSESSRELDVWPEFHHFAGDVISRTAFGGSYMQGMRILQLLSEQVDLIAESAKSIIIPGYRFLPTRVNRRRNEIEREVCALLKAMIEERGKEMKMGKPTEEDFLGLLLESNFKDSQEQGNCSDHAMTIEEVIEECKLFYLAGTKNTAILLTWTMVMLSIHPNWQMEARKEVSQVFGKNKPDFHGLNRLKIVTMILHEVLRLYPPVVLSARRVDKITKLGSFTLPAGTEVSLPTLLMHHDPEIWGKDAEEFRPERFAAGISEATNNQIVFFPFSWGPRICMGQNFAMIEAKMAMAMILQNFSFNLSPSYTHAPRNVLVLEPQYGAPLILHRL